MHATPVKKDRTSMASETKKALRGTMKELKREHPKLPERLSRYRAQRDAYDAKRTGVEGAAWTPDLGQPVRHAYRSLDG